MTKHPNPFDPDDTATIPAMDSDELNRLIGALDENPNLRAPDELARKTGKLVPYLGWWWRAVDWDRDSIYLSFHGGIWWFCQNDKWGYPGAYTTGGGASVVRRFAELLVRDPTDATLDAFFKVIQVAGEQGKTDNGWAE